MKWWVGDSSTALRAAATDVAMVVWAQERGMFYTLFLTVPSGHESADNMLKPSWPCLLCVSNGSFQVSAQSWINLKLNLVLGEKKTQNKTAQHPYLPWYSLLSSLTCFLCLVFYTTPVCRDIFILRSGSLEPMVYICSRYEFQDLSCSDANKNGRIIVKCLIV